MTQEDGPTRRKPSQADFVGRLALALMVFAVVATLVVLVAVMNAG